MNGFPFTNFHDINLDWILSKLKKAVFSINGQGPDENGNINLGGVAGVTSVNGVGPDSAGNVTLNAGNVGALPATYTAPVSSVNGKTGNVQLSASDVNALSNTYQPPVRSVNGQTGAVDLDASDVGALPEDWEAPVTSVNQMTGEINLTAADVGALPDTTTVPTRTSQLVNDSGFLTSQQAAAVTSVNGKIGAVVLDASDVSALPATTVVPTLTSQLINDSGYITSAQAAPVASVNGQVGAVVLDAAAVGATPVGEGIPAGGTTGQILTKFSASDYDAAWEDAPSETEEGENYIKFPNGTLICWGHYEGGSVTASVVGNMYRAAIAINAVFPVPFVDKPHVSASNYNAYGIVGEIDVSATGIQDIYLLRPNSGSIYPSIYWTAIGRWK